jgi:glycosyltransferase involved in cell wall biosynthesis
LSANPDQAVTWLLPVRNGAQYLVETLESLVHQTFPHQQILLWDNGSTDETVAIARRYIPHRLRGVIIADRPLPLGAALGAMIEMARTPLCSRIDADDIAEPHRLEVQVAALTRQPRIDVLGSCVTRIGARGELLSGPAGVASNHTTVVNSLLDGCALVHPSVLMRREAVLLTGNYRHGLNEPTGWPEDFDLWQRMAAARRVFSILPDQLLRYRIHPGSVTAGWHQHKELARRRLPVIIANARHFYGLSPTACALLHRPGQPGKFAALWSVFRQLARHDGLSPRARLAAFPEVFNWAWQLLENHDYASALALAVLASRRDYMGYALSCGLAGVTLHTPIRASSETLSPDFDTGCFPL